MADEREPFARPLYLIDGGRVAQVVVEYTGSRPETRHYRGRASRRQYVFNAGRHRQNYVQLEDTDHFLRMGDFRVLEESKIDPEEDRLKAIIKRELAEALASPSALPDQRQDEPARPASSRGGAPPIPLPEQQRLWHMRHHTLAPWSMDDLAREFLKAHSANPRAAIGARLRRFKESHPELLSDDVCPFCAEGYDPTPPDSR